MSSIDRNKRKKYKKTVDQRYRLPAWEKESIRNRAEGKTCEDCDKQAKVLDHLIRIKIGGAILNRRNHKRQCLSHHHEKTQIETRGYTYDFILTPNGFIPKYPLTWIKIPAWVTEIISKYGVNYIQNGQLYRLGYGNVKIPRL